MPVQHYIHESGRVNLLLLKYALHVLDTCSLLSGIMLEERSAYIADVNFPNATGIPIRSKGQLFHATGTCHGISLHYLTQVCEKR
jgi:hypothetical protein